MTRMAKDQNTAYTIAADVAQNDTDPDLPGWSADNVDSGGEGAAAAFPEW